MRQVIGKIESFAVEREITQTTPYFIGHLCLWIGGISLGAYEDEVMLSSVKAVLDSTIAILDKRQNADFLKLEKNDLFNLMYNGEFDNSLYLLHLAESFDDFSLFTFTVDDEIHFVWKLHDNPFFTYPNYPKEIIHKKVKISEFKDVIEDKELWRSC